MEVTFDKYSLMVDGKRVFIKSGAFHYFRTPGVKMALDRFQKMKAGSLRHRLSPKNYMKRKFTFSKFRDSLREWSLLFFYLRRPQTLTDLKSPQAAVLHNAFLSIPVGNLIPPCVSLQPCRQHRGP
jgi:hypothetical protein